MKNFTHRTVSDSSSVGSELSEIFENLNLQQNNMEEQIQIINGQMAMLAAANAELVQKLTELEETQTTLQAQQIPTSNVTIQEYTDVVPEYPKGEAIKLDVYKVIPEFNGDKKAYRSWRTQASKLMEQIKEFMSHPNYAAALGIIRAKITGPASDILINNNAAHNIDATIDRLDFSYADQRYTVYVIEAEMTAIKQHTKTLQEFYDAINQALNMVLTKITMTYKETAAQEALVAETQHKAILL